MYIFGASGHAKVIIEALISTGEIIDGIFDDDETIKSILDYQVLGKLDKRSGGSIAEIIIAVGNNKIRERIAKNLSFSFGNATHASSIISPSAQLGTGIGLMANTVINASTIVGNHVIINTSASVDHDCVIDDFVHIAPNSTICGGVQIGKGTLIGAGSVVIPNIKIGKHVTVGAGSIITKNIPSGVTVVEHNKIINNE